MRPIFEKMPGHGQDRSFFFFGPGSVELKKKDVILPRPLIFRPCEQKNAFFGVPKKCTFLGPKSAPDQIFLARTRIFPDPENLVRDADFPGFPDPSQTPRKWSPRTKKRARKWSPRTPENGQKWRPQTTPQDPRKWLLTPIFQASDPEIWPGPGNLAKTTRFGQNHHFWPENAVFSTFPAQTPIFAKKWLSG